MTPELRDISPANATQYQADAYVTLVELGTASAVELGTASAVERL